MPRKMKTKEQIERSLKESMRSILSGYATGSTIEHKRGEINAYRKVLGLTESEYYGYIKEVASKLRKEGKLKREIL